MREFKIMLKIITCRLYLQNHNHKNKICYNSSVQIELVRSYKHKGICYYQNKMKMKQVLKLL